jgi:hypothetical protein
MPRSTASALKAWKTRRVMSAWEKAHAAEAASKAAFKSYCTRHGWKVAIFEGKTGAPRTGIIDAVAFRRPRESRRSGPSPRSTEGR